MHILLHCSLADLSHTLHEYSINGLVQNLDTGQDSWSKLLTEFWTDVLLQCLCVTWPRNYCGCSKMNYAWTEQYSDYGLVLQGLGHLMVLNDLLV